MKTMEALFLTPMVRDVEIAFLYKDPNLGDPDPRDSTPSLQRARGSHYVLS